MATYAYRCAVHPCRPSHIVEKWFDMGSAPASIRCEEHGADCKRVYDFQFSPDNTRFFRNPVDGTRFSYSLGREMPDSKSELFREYEQRGIEPVTRKTMPEAWKADQEYAAAVRSGEKIEKPKPDISKGVTVLEQLRKSNVRFG